MALAQFLTLAVIKLLHFFKLSKMQKEDEQLDKNILSKFFLKIVVNFSSLFSSTKNVARFSCTQDLEMKDGKLLRKPFP